MSKKFGAGVFALLLSLFCAGAARAQAGAAATQPAAQAPPPATTTAQADPDDVDREDPCPGARTQSELNGCAARARDRADAELNKVYRELMKETGTAERAQLRAAQLAWIEFRDAQCDYESIGNKGGSIYPMVYSFCLAKVTAARARHLQEILREQTEQ
ncbi:MAG: lysozyme inhibitor LprI family protein [Acidobacteria bacterium]|nr:lysozyme inhibitor LprI family protein [Acidobacteriota bacterium]